MAQRSVIGFVREMKRRGVPCTDFVPLAIVVHAPDIVKEWLLSVIVALVSGVRVPSDMIDPVPFPHDSLFLPADAYR